MSPRDPVFPTGPRASITAQTALSLEPQRQPSRGSAAQQGGAGCCDSQISMVTASVSRDTHFGKEVLALQSNANVTVSAPGLSCPDERQKETAPKQALTPSYQPPSECPHPGNKIAVRQKEGPFGLPLECFILQAKQQGASSSSFPPDVCLVKSPGHLEAGLDQGPQREAIGSQCPPRKCYKVGLVKKTTPMRLCSIIDLNLQVRKLRHKGMMSLPRITG